MFQMNSADTLSEYKRLLVYGKCCVGFLVAADPLEVEADLQPVDRSLLLNLPPPLPGFREIVKAERMRGRDPGASMPTRHADYAGLDQPRGANGAAAATRSRLGRTLAAAHRRANATVDGR